MLYCCGLGMSGGLSYNLHENISVNCINMHLFLYIFLLLRILKNAVMTRHFQVTGTHNCRTLKQLVT